MNEVCRNSERQTILFKVESMSISLICKVLGVPRSTYYTFKFRKSSNRSIENDKLKQEIQTIYDESKGIYCEPKIHKIIYKKFDISLKRVQKIMKELGLRSIIIKKFKHNTTKVDIVEKDNVLDRDFSTSTINEKWVRDITYIHTIKDGWCYLASVMDLHTRKIVGYSFGKSMTTDLIIRALDNASAQRPGEGLIFHSDLGSQYTSLEFSKCMQNKGIIQSFRKKGCPYDNACIESFHAALKKEEVYIVKYFDYDSARLRLFEYIEGWYNRKIIYGSIGFISPDEYERLCRAS